MKKIVEDRERVSNENLKIKKNEHLKIDLCINERKWFWLKERILNIIRYILVGRTCSLSVLLTNDDEIQEFNKRFRNINKPTDVLSFNNEYIISDEKVSYFYIGDLILSYDSVKRKAIELKQRINSYVHYIVIHGVLHLLGYDHEKEQDWKIMTNIENKIAKGLGLNPLYGE